MRCGGWDRDVFPGFEEQLRRYADTIVRFGLNLRPGQRVLLAEPYELQGVARTAAPLVDAVAAAARAAGAAGVETLWGDEPAWRDAARDRPGRDFIERLERNTARLERAISEDEALVFPMSVHPGIADGVAPRAAARLRRVCGEFYGRLAPALMAGATNWTAVPAPTPEWADAVYAELPEPERMARLWASVLAACRADSADPVAAWVARTTELDRRCAELNARGWRRLRLHGPGTDLTLALPSGHRWCTALLRTRDGRRFAPNLPTEEVFTAPHRDSAEGWLRVARPVSHGGAVMEGVELEFRGGQVVCARARRGAELLRSVLASDRGAVRLGEVALVDGATPVARSGRCFRQALLDENAMNHVALGDGYAFTAAAGASDSLNRSVLHLDLPVEAEALLA
jgi:aminopeptidase